MKTGAAMLTLGEEKRLGREGTKYELQLQIVKSKESKICSDAAAFGSGRGI